MTAEVYYATGTQNAFGEFEQSWSFDRQINCSAIKENPQSQMRTALTADTFTELDTKLNMRTNENIFKAIDGTYYKQDSIMITNIKDPLGSITWSENSIKATNFEVDTVEPMYDEVHNVAGYRVLLRRSDLQVDI